MLLADPDSTVERAKSLTARADQARRHARTVRSQSRRLRLDRLFARLVGEPAVTRVAYVSAGAPASDVVPVNHAVDGDGASMCELFTAPELTLVDGVAWSDVPVVVACSSCCLLMQPL